MLLIDEPSLGLAPVIIETVYETIGKLAERDISILLVEENFTHIEASRIASPCSRWAASCGSGSPAEVAADETVAHSYLGVLQP